MSKHAPILPGATKRGHWCSFNNKRLRFIGSGRFTAAYWLTDGSVYLLNYYDDRSKDIIVKARQDIGSQHLPYIRLVKETDDRGHNVRVFKTKFYPVPRLKTEYGILRSYSYGVQGSRFATDIQKLKKAHFIASVIDRAKLIDKQSAQNFNREVVRQADNLRVDVNILDAMDSLIRVTEKMEEYYIFDRFRPTNLGIANVTGEPRIILLDPMFDYIKYNTEMKTRTRKVRRPR